MPAVQVNGRCEPLDADMKVGDLLVRMALRDRRIAVERNGEIVPRSAFDQTMLHDGDRIEIVIAVGGG
ncbi:MAG TPA: sulfur carrier protein ThiS [Methyloversatilis sp.]